MARSNATEKPPSRLAKRTPPPAQRRLFFTITRFGQRFPHTTATPAADWKRLYTNAKHSAIYAVPKEMSQCLVRALELSSPPLR